jgi:hypothetical protein
MKKKTQQDNHKIILYAAITVLVLIILLSLIKFPYTGMVTYTEKIPVTEIKNIAVKEPYQTKNCYEKNTSYDIKWGNIKRECLKQKCLQKNEICLAMNEFGNCVKSSEICESYQCLDYQINCKLEITNNDIKQTKSSLSSYVMNKNKAKTLIKNIEINLTPHIPKIISWQYNHSQGDVYNCWYNNLIIYNTTKCDQITKIKTTYKQQNITTIKETQKTVEIQGYNSLLNKILS